MHGARRGRLGGRRRRPRTVCYGFTGRYGFTAPTAQLPEDTRDPMPEDREEGLHCQRLSQRSPLAQSLARNPTIPQSAARMRSSASARRTSEAHHVHLVHHRLSAVAGS